MRAAVAGPLDERQVLGVLDRSRERADRLGQQVGEVGHLHRRGDFRLRLLGRVQHVRLALDQLHSKLCFVP